MSYVLENQIQQQKSIPVSLLTPVSSSSVHLPAFTGQGTLLPIRLAFADINNNIKLAETCPSGGRSVLLTSFRTKRPEHVLSVMTESPFESQLVTGDQSGRIDFLKISSKLANSQSFKLHLSRVNSIGFCAEGNRLLTASNDKTIKIYDVTGVGKAKKHPLFIQAFGLKSFALKAEILESSTLLSLEKKAFRTFGVESRLETFSFEGLPKDNFIDFHVLSENLVCLVTKEAAFRIVDLRTQKIEYAFSLSDRVIKKTRLAKDRAVILGYGKSKGGPSVFLLNVLDPKPSDLFEFEPKSEVNDLLIAPDASFFALATQSHSVAIYRSSTCAPDPIPVMKKSTMINPNSNQYIKQTKMVSSNLPKVTKSMTCSTKLTSKKPETIEQPQPLMISRPEPTLELATERQTPLNSHGSHNVPLDNLLSKHKAENPSTIDFDITNIISTIQQGQFGEGLRDQIQSLSILIQSHSRSQPHNPNPLANSEARSAFNGEPFSKRLFPNHSDHIGPNEHSQALNDNTELRTVDYNITETKQKPEMNEAVDYDELENFIKQREDYLKPDTRLEEDFSFKLGSDGRTNSHVASLKDRSYCANQPFVEAQTLDQHTPDHPEDLPESSEPNENPFADVLGKTFKTRDDQQIVIIDEHAVPDRLPTPAL